MDPTSIPIRDLHLPDPVGWWPLAPGWWILIALALLLALWLGLRALKRIRHAASRRYALRALKKLEADWESGGSLVAFGVAVSELVRRTMLAYAPRKDVAGLTGDAWLAWLDRGLANPVFVTGPGRALTELPYRNPAGNNDDVDVNGLIYAVRMRLATPVPEEAA